MINNLGLANRARKVIIGTDLTVKGIRQNRVKLVLLAKDASNNTKKLINDKSNYYKVPVIDIYSSEVISKAIGNKNIKVVSINDEGFSKLLLKSKEGSD